MLGAGQHAVRDVVICRAVRTPRGKGSPKGALHALRPVELVTHLLAQLGSVPADDVILGCATQTGDQGGNLARAAVLAAGWTAPALTINRFCASGMEAIALGAARIRAGDADLVVAGGVESVSRVAMYSDGGPLYASHPLHMGIAADLAATLDGTTRDELDAYADATRAKARAAAPSPALVPLAGLADDELRSFAPDTATQVPAFDASQDHLVLPHYPQLTQVLHLHTRANSPQLADAAALTVLADRATADRLGLPVLACIVASATASADPIALLTAGQSALEAVVARAGLTMRDLGSVEFAEAFAALCLRLMRTHDLSHERLNPRGGTIALGHAFGATGAILVANAIDNLALGRHAAAAVSGAAGLGAALLLERV